MNTMTMGTYRPPQKLHPLSLLAQLSSRQSNGCLRVSSGTTIWSIYLEQGKLLYATNSTDPFGRLDRHLRRLSTHIPSLVSAVRVQLRLLFETTAEDLPVHGRDYRALCWLVEQQHLTPDQAAALIEDLAKEVLETFLPIQTGHYELDEQDRLDNLPKFCQLELRPLVEYCQTQLRRRAAGQSLERDPLNRNGNYPSAKSEAPAAAVSSGAPRVSQPTQAAGKAAYTIACIDDSPTVLQAINSFLDDKSFSVIMISDPVKALMQIIRSKPDLILLDVTMPSLDGYELCSLLRKHPSFRHTPIIMVTGNTGFIDRAKAKLVGASGYLTKPFNQSDLIKIVFKHLS